MAIQELSVEEIEALVGTRHAATGIEYPPNGLQPYDHWLMRTLHLLAEQAAGPGGLRVARDDAGATTINIAPGRATIEGDALAFAGGVLDLASHNNDTAYVWAEADDDALAVNAGADGDGWPVDPHVKLAEVALAAGAIVSILDRRWDAVFHNG